MARTNNDLTHRLTHTYRITNFLRCLLYSWLVSLLDEDFRFLFHSFLFFFFYFQWKIMKNLKLLNSRILSISYLYFFLSSFLISCIFCWTFLSPFGPRWTQRSRSFRSENAEFKRVSDTIHLMTIKFSIVNGMRGE